MTESQLIVEQLKTHPSIKNVVPFGSRPLPPPPYAVVKLEPSNGFTRVRVIAHFEPNHTVQMEKYCKKDVFDLLAYKDLTNGGRRVPVVPIGLGPVVLSNDDKTISQEMVLRYNNIGFN